MSEKKNSPISRRLFLSGSLAVGGASLASTLTASGRARTRSAPSESYECGVASGDPASDSVILWTRIPESHQTGGDVEVRWEIGTSPGFEAGSIVQGGTAWTSADVDHTVRVRAGGLLPATWYYYRFLTPEGFESVHGRTRTAPDPDADPAAISLAFVSCQSFTDGYYHALEVLASDEVDFCIALGDNIYEDGGEGVRTDHVGEIEPDVALSLNDFRNKYKLYLSDPVLREVRRLFPWITLWDDHEVYNNYAGGDPEMSTFDRTVQANGYQAFTEFMPLPPEIGVTVQDGIPHVDLYRRFSFGKLLDLFATDQRQYRDPPVCTPEDFGFGCEDLYAEDRTMLGQKQARWLIDGLVTSAARWKIVMSGLMMMPMKLTNSTRPFFRDIDARETYDGFILNTDQWDGFPAERESILRAVEDNGVTDVVVITGDIHTSIAGVLRTDPTKPWTPAVGVEIVGGSVTSSGAAEYVRGNDLSDVILKALTPANPHIQYVDAKYHLYTRVDLTPERCVATYVAVDTITELAYGSFVRGRITVQSGSTDLEIEDYQPRTVPPVAPRRVGSRPIRPRP